MLTITQGKALDFIRGYIVRHGRAPTLDEIAAGLGIRSKGVAYRYVQALAEAGCIRLTPGRKRGIELAEGMAKVDMSLLLAGQIAAGRPIEAIPGVDAINPAELFLRPDRYALRVRGDSMVGAGILDGDTVVVRRCDTAEDGDIVVALIDGFEATLKRLRRQPDGTVMLIAENPDVAPMVYAADRVVIQGVMVGQFRLYC